MEIITVDCFRRLIIPRKWTEINVENDENAESVPFELYRYYGDTDLAQYAMYLKTVSSGGRDDVLLEKTVTGDKITAEWAPCPPQTSYPGALALQLYFTGEGFKWETSEGEITITKALDASPSVPVTPSAYDEWLASIKEAAESYPIIGNNGNWFVWDIQAGEFTDTGILAHGENGVTFTPSVSALGEISWTNNAGLPNPESVDLVAAVIAALPDGEAVEY